MAIKRRIWLTNALPRAEVQWNVVLNGLSRQSSQMSEMRPSRSCALVEEANLSGHSRLEHWRMTAIPTMSRC